MVDILAEEGPEGWFEDDIAAVVMDAAEEVEEDKDYIAGSCWDVRSEPSAAGEVYTEWEAAHWGP